VFYQSNDQEASRAGITRRGLLLVGARAGLTRRADFPLTLLIAWKQHWGEGFRNLRRGTLRSVQQPVVGHSPLGTNNP
jgi:hypothetical protein